MDGDPARNIQEWEEDDVQTWLTSIGIPQYENQIKEHGISGEVLCMLNHENLKAIGITSVGQRLSILKGVYNLKIASNIPIEPGDYVPPSELSERSEPVSLEKLHLMVNEQGQRIHTLEDENRALRSTLQSFVDDYNNLRNSFLHSEDATTLRDSSTSTLKHQSSFNWPQLRSPTKDGIESPHPSPRQLDHDVSSDRLAKIPSNAAAEPTPKPARQDSADNLNKSFKVSLEDPTWKVLPAALKKYRINNDNWQNYAMFICYGSAGNRIERCLSYDEKPLLLFQKLKDAKKNPVFMLKHIKDIRSPIAVAQQKQAQRKASSMIDGKDGSTSQAAQSSSKQPSDRANHRPPKLEVHDLSSNPPLTGLSPAGGPWLENAVSPVADRPNGSSEDVSVPQRSMSSQPSHPSTIAASGTGVGQSPSSDVQQQQPNIASGSSGRDVPPMAREVSYAVAIYPYMAEQDDEFDVVVGDTFVILSRARGWWVVQRDPTGSGVVETDQSKQGWVPAGCLLETNVPVASAIAEAKNSASHKTSSSENSPSSSSPQTPVSKTPILPLSIISTSFPGVALMDYKKKGEEELDLQKDDALRVFKRYNHWSYAVKEEGGDRGWVPSWYIGKTNTTAVAVTPATPIANGSSAAKNGNGLTPNHNGNQHQDDASAQVSPMSSAFPTQSQHQQR
ncbi:hypothetical protein FISHEDRAFT_69322 [Fistulina hepatica ATCC 64428]|uniref:RA-domain-containing protein n=1 Tax=Fistulina hepatica ATCC 64428 TaxID=1128425 RepID=A0A0D7APZ0_9AGAR|nr:hypothetical protein FISHEDRAFT_69322 [Fistulina hepatica ATCC 64428]